jgi:hypothetical protein
VIAAVGVIIGYCLVAVVAHELTHYVVAAVVGRSPSIDWVELEFYWQAPQTARDKPDELIAAAPVLVGAVLVLPLAASLDAGTDIFDGARVLAWSVYTLPVPLPFIAFGASLGDWNGVLGLIQRSWGKEAEA